MPKTQRQHPRAARANNRHSRLGVRGHSASVNARGTKTTKSLRRIGWLVGCILLAVVLLYWRTLSFEFVFDDWSYVIENPLLMRFESFAYPLHFTEFATAGEREGFDPDLCLNFILRPVVYFSFFINHALGGFDAGGFRIVNIAIHAANASLVFLLVAHMAKVGPRSDERASESLPLGPFSAALLFAIHPLQIESVTYVSQRFESLATFFFLASCLTYGRHLKDGAAF